MDLRGLGGPAAVSWAKTGPDGTWLSLADHAADAAAVAGRLWDSWLPEQITSRIAGSVGGNAEARLLVQWLAALHDVGKMSPQFAVKGTAVPDVLDGMRSAGLPVPQSTASVPRHGEVGQAAVRDWLRAEFGCSAVEADALAAVIGGHHGIPPTTDGMRNTEARVRSDGVAWVDARDRMIADVTDRLGARDVLARLVANPPDIGVQVLLAAIVVMCDWLASNTTLFPLGMAAESRTSDGLAAIPFTANWTPTVPVDADSLFADRFPALSSPTPLQRKAFRMAEDMTRPGLMVVEAGMGRGKTEAALLAAEVLAAKFGSGGVYVGLPTMATSSAMFGRLLDWSSTWDRPEPVEVSLAHGKASLVPAFAGLRGNPSGVHDDGCAAVASAWFAGRHTHLLATLVSGTVDQLLRSALQSRHVALRLLAFAGKVVVVDEVHAADDVMRVFLKASLTWLGILGTPVVMLSATLPPAQRDEYVQAYAAGQGVTVSVPSAPGYPVVTTFDGTLRMESVPGDSSGRSAALRTLTRSVPDLLGDLLADGGVAGVIRSTVASAQETYVELAQQFPGQVMLLHSALLASERAAREDRLVSMLGRGGHRPDRLIVVATQVIEQSLDIDLDVLVTDLGPVDSVLQRIGRVHRHASSVRPAKLADPVIYLDQVPLDTSSWPRLGSGSRAVYGPVPLLRAALVLRPHLNGKPLLLDADIPGLVEAAYGDLTLPSEWTDAAKKQKDTASIVRSREAYVLRHDLDRMNGMIPERVDEMVFPSMVRAGDMGLEVLLVADLGGGQVTGLPGTTLAGRPLSLDSRPGPKDALALAGCTVRLPLRVSGPLADERATAPEKFVVPLWQRSPVLSESLVVPLGPDGVEISGFLVSYDAALGLLVQDA